MTVAQQIQYAEISQYLAIQDIALGNLFGKKLDMRLPVTLYNERKAVEWMYSLNASDSNLIANGNYLYSLCGKYGLRAQQISGGNGTIAPTSPTLLPLILDFEVTSTSIITTGESSKVLSAYRYIGYEILLFRNNIQQSTVNNGGTYYSWDSTTATLTFLGGALNAGELITIYPVS